MAVTSGIEREARAGPVRFWPKLQRDTVVGAASVICFIVGWELASFVAPAYAVPGWGRILAALADIPAYERVALEADVRPLGDSLLIVFAYRDEAHFDYAHLSVDSAAKQPVHNGIFHVYGGERVRISSDRGPAAFSARGSWYHVRLIHDVRNGSIGVTVNGQSVPALQAVDRSLGSGKAGPGSFDETGDFRNIKITTAR